MANGESGELWKEPDQTVERVKEIRHAEATRAAAALGASYHCLDLGGPLRVDDEALDQIINVMTDFAPDVILTHSDRGPFNPDHGLAYTVSERARQSASGAGVASAFKMIRPPALRCFEPHQPELCGFVPTTFLDITPVFAQKVAAMEAMGAQSYLRQYYTERAAHRVNHARRIGGDQRIKQAEAFQRILPQVVKEL